MNWMELEILLYQVRGLPTLFFISPDSNKEPIRTEGLIPIQMMRDILDNEMWEEQDWLFTAEWN